MVGATLVEIGDARGTDISALEAAINAQTAAVVWFQGDDQPRRHPAGPGYRHRQRAHDVPVIIDGAAQLPPTENLWTWTGMGAALAVFSGGKDLHGPQPTGLIVGRAGAHERRCA
ncbi:MAG: hypothetical protein R2838_15315 [Caldilineaceae bacterium]